MNSPLIHNCMILIVSLAVVLFVSSSSSSSTSTTTANAFTATPSSTRSTQTTGRVTSSFLHMSSSSSSDTATTNEIMVGDVVPSDIVLMELTESSVDGKPVTINLSELCQDKKVLIFGVPGAFTPGCSKSHLPSFMTAYNELTTNHQIDLILCVATNDAYTMEAWGRMSGGTETGIRFVSDHTGALTKYWGLQMENPVGIRTKRFTAILDQNVVTHYFTSTPESSNTWAPAVLAAL